MDSSLENFIENISGEQYLRVQDDLGNGYVRLRAAEAQRRQAKQDIRSTEDIIIELLRNSRDAHAHALFVATWTEESKRFITILDDGDGIPASMHEVVFEPFVTSKLDSFRDDKWGVHGRGMALYSIKQNTELASIIASRPGLGSVFHIETDLTSLPEKKDQSTVPHIIQDSQGKSVLRGPHNIIRTVLEFAIEERNRISVYFGSSASIVATLYNLGTNAAAQLTKVFDSYNETTPYFERFAYTLDADSLATLATELGFPISTRTAHRIIGGEIKPLPLHIELLSSPSKTSSESVSSNADSQVKLGQEGIPLPSKRQTINTSKRLKFAKEDIDGFTQEIRRSYSALAEAYYLSDSVEISFKAKPTELIISIPIQPDDSNR